MAHWLLQGNPQRWRMDDFFREHPPDELTSWSITRNFGEVRKDDDVALWRAGRDAGVVALGRITGPAYEAPGDTDEYWQDIEKADRARWWLPIRLTEAFLDAPVTREELRHDPRFAEAAILRMPAAGSPFPLSDAEWAAILDGHRPSRAADGSQRSPASSWPLQPGETIRRVELHDRFGGSRQDGISYTGRGQRGDQTLTSGNLAVANHATDGRALRVFQGAAGVVRYVGEFVLDEQEPYDWGRAPSTGGGPLRRVIRFHLWPVDRPASTPELDRLGVPYREQDENVEPASPTSAAPTDPDAAGRGLRSQRRLQNHLKEVIEAAGYAPVSPAPADPDFDLAWEAGQTTFVVEVKSCTKANEVRQLRMGIGQVLDYEDALRARGRAVQAVLYLERAPSDPRWLGLAERHSILLAWPGDESALFSASMT